MNDSLRLWPVVPALAILTLLPTAGCSGLFNDDVTADFHAAQAHAPALLEIHNPVGRIDVEVWNKPGVEIDARKRGASEDDVRAIKISVVPKGSALVVTSDFGSGGGSRRVDYTIHAPANVNLTLDQSVGGIAVHGFAGNLDITTSTGAADVKMANVSAPQRIAIDVKIGRVNLELPANAAATIKASATIGDIKSDFPISVARVNLGAAAKGTIGGGGAAVDVTSDTGGIEIGRE